jgi:hypothetical protein
VGWPVPFKPAKKLGGASQLRYLGSKLKFALFIGELAGRLAKPFFNSPNHFFLHFEL